MNIKVYVVLLGFLVCLTSQAWAVGSCTIHGSAGASSSKVVSANDVSPGRVYLFIQNTGTVNGLNFSIGQAGGATTSDVYLGPGTSFSFPVIPLGTFTTPVLPPGQVDVIQNGGATTYAFCDF